MTSKHLISRLLSGRNRLSRPERDALRDAILGQVAPRRRRWVVAAPALALAGAAALLFMLPRPSGSGGEITAEGELTPRGAAGAVAALALACPHSGTATCRQGETLHFDVGGTVGYRHFAAFARRDDGVVIWYFPESSGTAPVSLVPPGDGGRKGVLDRGIVLGDDHPPGRYRVFGIFSERELDREAIVSRFDESGPSVGPNASVVVREVIVK